MNTFMNEMVDKNNFGYTENGAVKHLTTKSSVLDMFALCGAYRNRTDEDCILAFKNAYEENQELALKCLFYLRDCRGGQGERRFFRVCFKWLAQNHANVAIRNIENIAEYGRYDDILYTCVGTDAEGPALDFIARQFALDMQCETPSLLAKWLPSENASAKATKKMGSVVRMRLNLSHKEYRLALSSLRSKINIVEKLMSQNRWSEIQFDKIPSKAGLIYKNAFARRDIIAKKFESFAKSKDTKVNASVLNPVDIADKIFSYQFKGSDMTNRAMLQKYWDNLKDYYNGREENGLAIVDVSGSMDGQPLNAAVSMCAYIAERGRGPFANHFVTFSNTPTLVKFEGVDIADKFRRAQRADWSMSTNIEAVFDMLLNIAQSDNVEKADIPSVLYIFSDMEFNRCLTSNQSISRWDSGLSSESGVSTLLENIAHKWANAGYELPRVVFWNLNARTQNIPAMGGRFSYVSGFSMNMVEAIFSGKDGYDLMLEKLMSDRYKAVC